jgi:hypothetical protein
LIKLKKLKFFKMQIKKNLLIKKAKEILKQNERAGFIMPDQGYYEGVWLWDTGFIAIGEACFDPEKSADRLLNFILQAQWKNGFIPHILFFNKEVKNYFPGPKYWRTWLAKNRPAAETSGVTQPPNLAFCTWLVYKKLKRKNAKKAKRFLLKIYPLLLKYHQYLLEKRDPEGSGLISIFHPWESGMDNSPRWQEVLSRVAITKKQIKEIKQLRRDIKNLTKQWGKERNNKKEAENLALSMRPTNEDYARFYYLVRFMADREYDDGKIYHQIPFNVKDVLFNSIFCVSNEALLLIAGEIKEENGEVQKIRKYLKKQKAAIKKLYDEKTNLYYDLDVKTKKLIKRKTIASFAPLFAGIPTKKQARKIAEAIESQEFKRENSLFLIPSTAYSDSAFHPTSYWRGPIWLPTNWLVLRGFERLGLILKSEKIKKALVELISKKGFWEYYNPQTKERLGRKDSSWTAALIIELFESF